MNCLLEQDIRLKPEIFHWAGPVPRTDLFQWIKSFEQWIPDELLEHWLARGGGDMFEGEELLSPVRQNDYIGTVEDRTAWYRAKGLSGTLYLFHEGSVLSAIDPERKVILTFSLTLQPQGEFPTLEEWYRSVVRPTGEQFYQLPKL